MSLATFAKNKINIVSMTPLHDGMVGLVYEYQYKLSNGDKAWAKLSAIVPQYTLLDDEAYADFQEGVIKGVKQAKKELYEG